MVQPIQEENEGPEEKMEDDMSSRIARQKAREEAKLLILQNKRSKYNCSPDTLLSADECNCSIVPPSLTEETDVMVRNELLSLLEHDNQKYRTNGVVQKENKIKKWTARENSTSVPLINHFKEDELKEANHYLLKECTEIGHESEPFPNLLEAHGTFLNDVMHFPT